MKEFMEKYMRRCLEIASSAEGLTAPNPMVGALLVCEGRIISEGKHAFYGASHAEPEAISKVKDVELLKKSILYVNLEPCCHYGKTPPCTEKIIAAGIPYVVVAALDTSSKINGKGIKILNDAGIKTDVGILEKEARELNRFFYTYHEKKRPYILLKWAQTPDGFIDSDRTTPQTPPVKISNHATQIVDHHHRSQYQAIMVGTNTIIMDNPSLTTRCWYGKNPLRITIDRHGKLNGNYNIFNHDAKSLVFTTSPADYGYAEVIVNNSIDVEYITGVLFEKKIQSLIVEGGTQLIESFIRANLWDEAMIFIGDFPLKKGVKAPVLNNDAVLRETLLSNKLCKIYNS
ncbi:MAG: bifunctional diaminohydroxyphosphoribosylaminopyrimidine deaminase/5-amino-6-(5-phosphoribosylamino)uracil reductase RibD [Prevotellaceae bacterium]|jgi:diaminohydroxyphosphoribosylaminopyrimidine deaminase/5-amino-6-(5-phosphoribosylamino)uracil reductase|nr:bifunctional diaminohydroxyphosphoribosylaminopyrimidine deaminase/5-amino-6-(5-phosphoribosylamino)uracil reductase RibD [Prevotellaceae bacterium]